jgi:hypothetical protein
LKTQHTQYVVFSFMSKLALWLVLYQKFSQKFSQI